MINLNPNLSFGAININSHRQNNLYGKTSLSQDTFESVQKKEKMPIPLKVKPYSKKIAQMDEHIDKAIQYVSMIQERAEKRGNYAKRLYSSIIHGASYKNVLKKDVKLNGDKYSTLLVEDQMGDIGKIIHLKNGEIQVIYDVLTTLRQNEADIAAHSDDDMRVNSYTFMDGKCVEFAANIKNKVKDYLADTEYGFEFPQWPCRNRDNSPIEKIIGFKDDGGYQYYEDYVVDIPGGYTSSVINRKKEDGSNLITCSKNDGFVYTIDNDPKGRRPVEHILTVRSPIPSINVW